MGARVRRRTQYDKIRIDNFREGGGDVSERAEQGGDDGDGEGVDRTDGARKRGSAQKK